MDQQPETDTRPTTPRQSERSTSEPKRSEDTHGATLAPVSPVSLEGLSLRDLGALDTADSLKSDTLVALRTGKGRNNFAAEFSATGRVHEHGSHQGIQVEMVEGTPLLRDGRHRLTVARELGRPTVYGQVYDGEREPGKKPIYEGQIPIAPRGTVTLGSSTRTSDAYELERFKRDVDLSVFAASRGYALDKRESSASCRVMRHAGTGDKIIVGKAADGHWQYFSVRDRDDNGTIIDFVQQRAGGRGLCPMGAVRKELREWTHTERELPQFARAPVEAATKDRAAVALEVACSEAKDTHPYLEARGLTRETLSNPRFHGTWRQSAGPHRNVIFLHHDQQGLAGFEVKNREFTGFARGGDKGLWSSKASPTDNRLVIAESAIDALSYHQVNPHPKTRYVSFGGAQNPGQPVLLESAISWMPAGSTVVAATDKDKAGHEFANQIQELCAKHGHIKFERHAPELGKKDWNDHLRELRFPTRVLHLERPKSQGLER